MKVIFLKKHWLVLMATFVVGLIGIAPHIIFRVSLGDDYRGIYLMETANELEYLARIREIIDGNWSLGSVPFFEYKNNPSLMPPSAIEILSAVASKFSGVSAGNVVIFSKFFLTALFFILVYFLTRQLTSNKDFLSNKINAVGAGLLVVLGYDLVDFRSLFGYLKGATVQDNFLLWTRPVNPIFGGLLIFGFLLIILQLYKNNVRHKYWFIAGGGFLLALAITSYFFSWGMILSIMAMLGLVSLLKKRYFFVKNIFFIFLIAVIFASPYFYNVLAGSRNAHYQESILRTGLLLTHQPILNKFLLFSLAFFLLSVFLIRRLKARKSLEVGLSLGSPTSKDSSDWGLFSLCMILAGFIAFNQQIITGRAVWPFHFVQYTIPLGVVAALVAFYNLSVLNKKIFYLWIVVIFIIIASSLAFGVFTQASAYGANYDAYKNKQKYANVFEWFDKNASKDCAVLSKDRIFLNRAIPAFTKCNVYLSDFGSFLMPTERLYHNYLVYMRLSGVSEKKAKKYISNNSRDISVYLYAIQAMASGSVAGKYDDLSAKLEKDYKDFLKKDFREELKKYRADYLMVDGPSGDDLKKLIGEVNPVYDSQNIFIYKI